MFEKIKRFFELGLYSESTVHNFAVKGVISEEQYRAIVGGE